MKKIIILCSVLISCGFVANNAISVAPKNVDATCKNLISKMPDYKSSEYVFKNCTFDEEDNNYVVSQTASKYRYFYYYSANGTSLLGTISMLSSKTNSDDVVFTATNAQNKINYIFTADYYVVMSSRKALFSHDHVDIYFPGKDQKHVTIHTGEVGKLNKDGTFELKPMNALGVFNVKKYDAYGNMLK